MEPNRYRYLRSLANEVLVQSNRVRDLIGDTHWLSDGHHKEYLLTDLIRRHLPNGIKASRGFVIETASTYNCTKEQDILIFDTAHEPPAFNQGDLAIAFPRTVIATVSVKTELDKKTFTDTLQNISTLLNVCSADECKRIFFAGYFYDISKEVLNNPKIVYEYFSDFIEKNRLESHKYNNNLCICLGGRYIYRTQQFDTASDASKFCGYNCAEMATGVFLANLIDHICQVRTSQPTAFSEYATFNMHPL